MAKTARGSLSFPSLASRGALCANESKNGRHRVLVLQHIAEYNDGESPSGKAPGFGPGIRGFESLLPSHEFIEKTTD